MNDEINKGDIVKENSSGKPKMVTQNIVVILLIGTILSGASMIIGVGANGSGEALALGFIGLLGISFFGIIAISIIGGIISLVKLTRNKEQLILSEKKIRNRWLIFDIFFFLIIPIGAMIYSVVSWMTESMLFIRGIFFAVFSIISAGGIQLLVKNKNNSVFSRISGWFLITLAFLFIFLFLYGLLYN